MEPRSGKTLPKVLPTSFVRSQIKEMIILDDDLTHDDVISLLDDDDNARASKIRKTDDDPEIIKLTDEHDGDALRIRHGGRHFNVDLTFE